MRALISAPLQIKGTGFTLIELLIAISLLGLISVVTYSAIWTASHSLHAVEGRVEANDELRVTQEFFRQVISQARAVMAVKNRRMQVVFQGEQNLITFVAPAPLQRGNAGGLYRYRLDLDGTGNNSRTLRLSYWQYIAGEDFDPEVEPEGEVVLMDKVKLLEFSFYGKKDTDSEPEWLEEWPRTNILPQLVRLELQSEQSNDISTLTVAIKGQVG